MQTTDSPAIAPWGKWDKLSLQLILVAAVAYALVVAVLGVIMIVGEFTSGSRTLSLFVDQPLPAVADAGTAKLVDGHFDTAAVTVSGLTPATSALLSAGSIIGFVTQLLVAASFVYLTWRLLRREPFLKSLTWTFLVAGSVLLIGTIIGQALSGFGGWLVATELGSSPDGESFWPLVMQFDPAPIGLAFVLLLVGCAFDYGQRLSRETAGLV
jgi:hypothetical protein